MAVQKEVRSNGQKPPIKRWILWASILCVLLLGAWAAYRFVPVFFQRDSESIVIPSDWVTHQDPKGFTISHPRGWKVLANSPSGRVELVGGRNLQVTIWPLFIAVELTGSSASDVLTRLTGRALRDVQWDPPEMMTQAAVRQRGISEKRQAVAILSWGKSGQGTALFFYLLVAPPDDYRDQEETFAAILSSFNITGGGGTRSQNEEVIYVPWEDPREKAFSFEIPEEWQVNGGLFRAASTDPHPAFVAFSPNGKIRITGGDSGIPTFMEPSPALETSGVYEGSWYSAANGTRLMVRRFPAPTDFVKDYIAAAVAHDCSGLSFDSVRDRVDAAKAINTMGSLYTNPAVIPSRYAGEAAFSCRLNDQWMGGYYFVELIRTPTEGGVFWAVEYIYGYIAPKEDQEQAQSTLEHLLNTFQLRPEWAAKQHTLSPTTPQLAGRISEQIASVISDAFQYRGKTDLELSRRWENAVLGMEDMVDPLTGQQIKLESGSDYRWLGQGGGEAPSTALVRPAVDFRELVRLP
jgi:hypothetical protein